MVEAAVGTRQERRQCTARFRRVGPAQQHDRPHEVDFGVTVVVVFVVFVVFVLFVVIVVFVVVVIVFVVIIDGVRAHVVMFHVRMRCCVLWVGVVFSDSLHVFYMFTLYVTRDVTRGTYSCVLGRQPHLGLAVSDRFVHAGFSSVDEVTRDGDADGVGGTDDSSDEGRPAATQRYVRRSLPHTTR